MNKNYSKYFFDSKNSREKAHCIRVAKYCKSFGDSLGIQNVALLHDLALFHDIGKIKVKKEILNKREKLTPVEVSIIKKHTIYSQKILSKVPELKKYAYIVRSHHERWDGEGYPDGLKDYDIPLYSRIISIVDVFDALTSERPYRSRAYTVKEARYIISKEVKSQFDPNIVKKFNEYFDLIFKDYKTNNII